MKIQFIKNNFWLLLFNLICCSDIAASNKYHTQHTQTPIHFQMSTIDNNASGSYGLIGHDITKNGYLDLVSFAYTGTTAGQPEGEIYWYEFQPEKNNAWKKHLITKKKHVVEGDFMDVDQDGYDDLIFMSDFEVPIKDANKEGNIWWAKRPKNLNAPEWKTYWIGRSPGAHRIVAADLQGTGKKQIIVVPLFGPGKPPIYGPGAITLYIPGNNPKEPWNKTAFSTPQFHAIHNAITVPKKDEQGENILIAAQEGIVMLSFQENKQHEWKMQSGILHHTPKYLESDKTMRDQGFKVLGRTTNPHWDLSGVTALSKVAADKSLIAAIDYTNHSGFLLDEPWHGDTVSIYQPKKGVNFFTANGLERTVLEKRNAGGHAVQIADFTGNGCQDVVAGFRAYPTALVLYLCHKQKTIDGTQDIHYEKQIISERSANSIVVGNWHKNGLPDIVTAGYGNEGDPYILMWTNMTLKRNPKSK